MQLAEFNPGSIFEQLARKFPGAIDGMRELPNGKVVLPMAASGFLDGVPIDMRSILQEFGEAGRQLSGQAGRRNEEEEGMFLLSGRLPPHGVSDESRLSLCEYMLRIVSAGDIEAALRDYRECVDEYQTEADRCQADSDGDGIGDACDG